MPLKLELGDVVQMKKAPLRRRPVGDCKNRNGYKDKVPKMREAGTDARETFEKRVKKILTQGPGES